MFPEAFVFFYLFIVFFLYIILAWHLVEEKKLICLVVSELFFSRQDRNEDEEEAEILDCG
jgi:hypothetical protein